MTLNTEERSCLTIILAAGEGTRMKSSMPKVLHPVAGLPMVCHVLDTCMAAGGGARAIVVGSQAERVAKAVTDHDQQATTHIQHKREGTAKAVLAARDAIMGNAFDDVVVLYGDVPLISVDTLWQARQSLAAGTDIVVLGFETNTPTGYGRLIIEEGELTGIVEEKDASDEQRRITFCNCGIMAFRGAHVLDVLDQVDNKNEQGEYYLPDAVKIGRAMGLKVAAIAVDEDETLGVNDRTQLAQVSNLWQQRRRHELMLAGVTMSEPHTIILHHDTVVEPDAELEPYVVFGPGVTVASQARIRAFSHLEGCRVGKGAIVGPYARLRPGAELAADSKVGNFVEIKAAHIGEGAKVNHLSYVGDASVGAKANIGAGSVTCNYDGFLKHKTIIGAGAFIGTNTSLVAPVNIGKNANTAAGSVIYEDVPADDLAIERSKQANLPGKAKKLRDRNAQRKRDAN